MWREHAGLSVRISIGALEADLTAAIQPGVAAVYIPRVESPEHLFEADALIGRLEKLRGIRPGTVQIRPLIESPRGVSLAGEIAASSARITTFGLGPHIGLHMDADALDYARAQCELVARARHVASVDLDYARD
jgi:citrate lyase subunit beta/citryl-CoA lyase